MFIKNKKDQYKAEIVVDNNSEYWGGQLEQIEINDEITVINEPFKLQSSHQVLYVPFRIFNHIVSKYFTNYINLLDIFRGLIVFEVELL